MKMLILLLLCASTHGVEISGCCPEGTRLDLDKYKCENRSNDTIALHFTPKFYSFDLDSFVNKNIEIVSPAHKPKCGPGKTLNHVLINKDQDENFVIVSDDNTLFITSDTSVHDEYCLSDVGDAGLAAVFCVDDVRQHCEDGGHVCVSLCCPPNMIVNISVGHCVYKQDYQLQPPFTDDVTENHEVVTVHGDPECNVTIYDDPNQFQVSRLGLQIGHHVLNISQYCLEEVQAGHEVKMIAKVCDRGDEEDRQLLDVISSKLTPVLLIISELFLFLTFVLHVIVPEFRKQMFGRCHCLHIVYTFFYILTIQFFHKSILIL